LRSQGGSPVGWMVFHGIPNGIPSNWRSCFWCHSVRMHKYELSFLKFAPLEHDLPCFSLGGPVLAFDSGTRGWPVQDWGSS
jgi:hypothetical protein